MFEGVDGGRRHRVRVGVVGPDEMPAVARSSVNPAGNAEEDVRAPRGTSTLHPGPRGCSRIRAGRTATVSIADGSGGFGFGGRGTSSSFAGHGPSKAGEPGAR